MLSLPKQNNKFWQDTVSYFWGDTLPKFLLNKEKNMKVNPVRDRVLVKPFENETKTKSGLMIPENIKDKTAKGKVLSVGTGKLTKDGVSVPMIVKEGDTVIYDDWAGQMVLIDNEEYRVLKEEEIIATVE
jgi:chaperonin GroES